MAVLRRHRRRASGSKGAAARATRAPRPSQHRPRARGRADAQPAVGQDLVGRWRLPRCQARRASMARVGGLDLEHVLGRGAHREPAARPRTRGRRRRRSAPRCGRSSSTGSPLSVASRIRRRWRSSKPSVRLPGAHRPAGHAARLGDSDQPAHASEQEVALRHRQHAWPARRSAARRRRAPRRSRGRPRSSAWRRCGSSRACRCVAGVLRPRPAARREAAACRPGRARARPARRR